MDSNTHSGSRPAGLAALAAAVDELAAQDLDGQTDAVLADQVLELRRLLDRLEGHWLRTLAAAPPAPTKASRPAPPPAGCGADYGWAPVPPPAGSAPPGPCTAAP